MSWVLLLQFLLTCSSAAAFSAPREQTIAPAATTAASAVTPSILPAREPLPALFTTDEHDSFSLLSYNILLPNSQDNWWCHKQYASEVAADKRQWPHRHRLIRERLLHSAPTILCIQEADGDTFDADFAFLRDAGYDHVLHRKFRFRCATFFRRDRFALAHEAHKDRTLVTSLRSVAPGEGSRVLHVVNCHLSGGTAPERRLRQVHDAVDQIRKYNDAIENKLSQQRKSKRPSPKGIAEAEEALREYQKAGIIVCGDFNSDGNTAVRKLLVEGSVDPDWREPQYPHLRLTSKRRAHAFRRNFTDAAELAYGGNVCDGSHGELNSASGSMRPATYVVPNLASRLLRPLEDADAPARTQFGMQIARTLAETLNLRDFCTVELDRAFDQVDEDGNGSIDRDEVLTLLETVYVATYGEQIAQERGNFFRGFGNTPDEDGLTKEQFISRLKALQQDLEGGRKAFGLSKGLDLQKLNETEMREAFDNMDLDKNGKLDEDEYTTLLETVYKDICGEEIEKQRAAFFRGFQDKGTETDADELTREQFTEYLLAIHQELEGGRKGSELAEVRTEADAQKMIARFTPLFRVALDEVFVKLSNDGETLTPEEVEGFLIETNGELGRGGTFRHSSALFQQKREATEPVELTRIDWYGIFARELAEGKWWQVVFDLKLYGSDVTLPRSSNGHEFYQGWLDYIYFNSLTCTGVQDVLTEAERKRVYRDGDGLPNEWHPSDHLPVAAIFSWKKLRPPVHKT